MRGGGLYCQVQCEPLVRAAAKAANQNLDKCGGFYGWDSYVKMTWCWGGKQQVTLPPPQGKIWIDNCTPVMDFYCGAFKGKVLKSDTGMQFDACATAVRVFSITW